MPREWEERLKNWVRINRSNKAKIRGGEVPDRNDEYFLYQTLLGAYPAAGAHDAEFIERLKAYLVKAVREAKVHTEWLKPDEDYEKGFIDFAEAILRPGDDNRFLADFVPFAESVAHSGMLLSLAQTLLKMTAPGVPDIYQGTEFWDLSFVDPDNRRPVDFAERRRQLADLKTAEARDRIALLRDLLARWQDGRIKLYLSYKLLTARRESSRAFRRGGISAAAGRRRDERPGLRFCPAFEWLLGHHDRAALDRRNGVSRRYAVGGILGIEHAPSVSGSARVLARCGQRRAASKRQGISCPSQRFFNIFPWLC